MAGGGRRRGIRLAIIAVVFGLVLGASSLLSWYIEALWFDSLGYYPPSPASGGWQGKQLVLVRGSLRGNARHVYEFIDDDSYALKIQFSPDAEGWADVLTGVYRRIH